MERKAEHSTSGVFVQSCRLCSVHNIIWSFASSLTIASKYFDTHNRVLCVLLMRFQYIATINAVEIIIVEVLCHKIVLIRANMEFWQLLIDLGLILSGFELGFETDVTKQLLSLVLEFDFAAHDEDTIIIIQILIRLSCSSWFCIFEEKNVTYQHSDDSSLGIVIYFTSFCVCENIKGRFVRRCKHPLNGFSQSNTIQCNIVGNS